MELKLLVLCLIHRILISETVGEITLPFTELVATVKPIKPKSSALSIGESQHPSIPRVPKLNEAILELFKSLSPELDHTSPIVCEYSSPLVLTASSRTVPVSNTELNNINGPLITCVDLSNAYDCSSCPQNYFNQQFGADIMVPNIPLPSRSSTALPSSLSLPQYIQENYSTDESSFLEMPIVTMLPKLTLEHLTGTTNSFVSVPNFNNPFSSYSSTTMLNPQQLFRTNPSQNLFSFRALTSIDPSYSLPYPLRYEQLSLPEVLIPQNVENSNLMPNLCQENHPITEKASFAIPQIYSYKCVPKPSNKKQVIKIPTAAFHPTNPIWCSRQSMQLIDSPRKQAVRSTPISNDIPVTSPSSINSASKYLDPFAIELPNFEPDLLEFTPNAFDFDSSPHFVNNLDSNVEYMNNFVVPDMFPTIDSFVDTLEIDLENNFRNCHSSVDTFCIPEIPDSIPEFIPLQDICIERSLPEIPVLPCIKDTILPQSYSSPIIHQPSTPPSTIVSSNYINISPSFPQCESSSKALSSINNMISSITQSILSGFTAYLRAVSVKPKPKLPSNFYVANQSKQDIFPYTTLYSSPVYDNLMSSTYVLPASTQTIAIPNNAYSIPNLIVSKSSSSQFNSVYTDTNSSDFTSDIIEMSSVTPVKVTVLPPASFTDYSPPHPCPSYLPSPIIPSNFDIPQVVKLKTSKKSTKTLQKLIGLLFLVELLNANGNIDYDTLDALLALLCV